MSSGSREETDVAPDPARTSVAERPVQPADAPAGRRLVTSVGLVVLVASALLGSNIFGLRDRLLGSATPKPTTAASSRAAGAVTATTTPARTLLRSQPWWQQVTTIEGAGPMTAPPFTIDGGALQWRVRWTCDSGYLLVQAQQRPKPLVDAACPGGADGFGTRTGPTNVQVTADGPWKLNVEQQVDIPLVEPPTPTMTAPGSKAVASGSFYKIDQSGTGTVTIYRQADGSHALRLDDFFVSPNSELEVRLIPLKAPHSSEEVSRSPYKLVTKLDVTTGSLNFSIPATIDPTEYGSVVIWCQAINSAYAAATLEPTP